MAALIIPFIARQGLWPILLYWILAQGPDQLWGQAGSLYSTLSALFCPTANFLSLFFRIRHLPFSGSCPSPSGAEAIPVLSRLAVKLLTGKRSLPPIQIVPRSSCCFGFPAQSDFSCQVHILMDLGEVELEERSCLDLKVTSTWASLGVLTPPWLCGDKSHNVHLPYVQLIFWTEMTELYIVFHSICRCGLTTALIALKLPFLHWGSLERCMLGCPFITASSHRWLSHPVIRLPGFLLLCHFQLMSSQLIAKVLVTSFKFLHLVLNFLYYPSLQRP